VAVDHVTAALEQRGYGVPEALARDDQIEVAVGAQVVPRIDDLGEYGPLDDHERDGGGVERRAHGRQLPDHLHVVREVEVVARPPQRAKLGVEIPPPAGGEVQQVRDPVLGCRLANLGRCRVAQQLPDALGRLRPVMLDGAAPQQLVDVRGCHENRAIGWCPERPGGGPTSVPSISTQAWASLVIASRGRPITSTAGSPCSRSSRYITRAL